MDRLIKKLLHNNVHPSKRLSIDQFINKFCNEYNIIIDLTNEQRMLLSDSGKWINIDKLEKFGLNNYAELVSEVDKQKGLYINGDNTYVSYYTFKYIVCKYNAYAIRYLILLTKFNNYYARYRYECDIIYNERCAKNFISEIRKLHLQQMNELIYVHKNELEEKNKIISELKVQLQNK